jgi:uncharacterized membrane protein
MLHSATARSSAVFGTVVNMDTKDIGATKIDRTLSRTQIRIMGATQAKAKTKSEYPK